MVVTGFDDNSDNERDYSQVVDLHSPKQCSNLPPYPLKLRGATGVILNGSPLICGGYGRASGSNSSTSQSSCYMFDKILQKWKHYSNMNTVRNVAASALIGETMWVTGGYQAGIHLKTTEFIHPNGTVTSGPTLPDGRSTHCLVNLHDGRIMILGGHLLSYHKNVSIYDSKNNTFTPGPSLIYDRSHAGCTLFLSPLHNNRPVVLIAGGYDQSTAEVFDYTNGNTWEESKYIFEFMKYLSS